MARPCWCHESGIGVWRRQLGVGRAAAPLPDRKLQMGRFLEAGLRRDRTQKTDAKNGHKKIPGGPGIFLSDGMNVCRLFAFGSDGHVESNALIFCKRLVAVTLYCRKVGKQVFTTFIRRDEAKTLCIVEPFHSTSCHCISYFPERAARADPMIDE